MGSVNLRLQAVHDSQRAGSRSYWLYHGSIIQLEYQTQAYIQSWIKFSLKFSALNIQLCEQMY